MDLFLATLVSWWSWRFIHFSLWRWRSRTEKMVISGAPFSESKFFLWFHRSLRLPGEKNRLEVIKATNLNFIVCEQHRARLSSAEGKWIVNRADLIIRKGLIKAGSISSASLQHHMPLNWVLYFVINNSWLIAWNFNEHAFNDFKSWALFSRFLLLVLLRVAEKVFHLMSAWKLKLKLLDGKLTKRWKPDN